MLKSVHSLRGFAIHATDGEIGKVEEFFFDDQQWRVRYLVIETGGWLAQRSVLISPLSVTAVDFDNSRFDVSLTREQIEKSPDIDTQQPVSRRHELEYMNYYGFPSYWGDSGLLGAPISPAELVPALVPDPAAVVPAQTDSHVRSTHDVVGYEIQATDGPIGHVVDFILDVDTWRIVYAEVSTRNWLPGKKVLLSPDWIQEVSWSNLNVKVNVTQEAIRSAPEYLESKSITREYETALHDHYGMPHYWTRPGVTEKP